MTRTQYQTLLGAIQRSAEETRLYVDRSVQRSAEETRRYVDESVRRSAEETRRYVDESVQRSAEETRRYVDHSAEETRRHLGISIEDLRSQIQLVAEGVSSLDTRLENARQEAAAEAAETRAQMKIYFGHLDRRVTALEGSVADLNVRFDRFEASGAR
jgi:polyhydroxyalkanoate synthesis regulator phasin